MGFKAGYCQSWTKMGFKAESYNYTKMQGQNKKMKSIWQRSNIYILRNWN